MKNSEILSVLDVYYKLASLKLKERQGFVNWNVSGIRRESVPEHVFTAQQLAWILWSECGLDIDIFKVSAMLALHETEESVIGDITPADPVTAEEKLEMGKVAVDQVLGKLKKADVMISLIDEFNAEETPEAMFAHLCDKLDCDLSIKKYSDDKHCSIENATEKMQNHPKTKQYIADGAKTVGDIFIAWDEGMYTGTLFEDVINFIKTYDTSKY